MLSITDYFDQIYIINLPYRKDRRDEVEDQLKSIGLSLKNDKVNLFSAIRPAESGEFDSIGIKGAFLSHLGVLKNAKNNGYQRILILEDDVNFSKNFTAQISETLDFLNKKPWNIFYGGHRLDLEKEKQSVVEVPHANQIVTAHFIAVQGSIIDTLIHELDLMLSRKNGDAKGGPMHVDGAYSTVRKNYPEYITYAANPTIGFQRASRTDIHHNRWFDRLPIIKQVVSVLRKVKNHFVLSTIA